MSEREPERRTPAQATPDGDDSEVPRVRPTVDELSEWSFPASDPPASWTWEVDRPSDA